MTAKQTRLSVNINAKTAAVLLREKEERGTYVTESVRRAVSLYDLCLTTVREGGFIVTEDADGTQRKVVLLP